MPYETLLNDINGQGIYVYEKTMRPSIKGLQADNVIWINKDLSTQAERACILAEELGHYHTSYGDILDQKDLRKRKQELRARQWAYDKLVPLTKIVQAHKQGIKSKYELASYLDVTEPFLDSALERYKEKYGLSVNVGYFTVCFEPLGVVEWFDW